MKRGGGGNLTTIQNVLYFNTTHKFLGLHTVWHYQSSRIGGVPSSGAAHFQPTRHHRNHSPPVRQNNAPVWNDDGQNTHPEAESLLETSRFAYNVNHCVSQWIRALLCLSVRTYQFLYLLSKYYDTRVMLQCDAEWEHFPFQLHCLQYTSVLKRSLLYYYVFKLGHCFIDDVGRFWLF